MMKVDDDDAVLMVVFSFVFFGFFTVLTSSKPNINFISEIKVIIILWFFPKRNNKSPLFAKRQKQIVFY